jgi:hypothetical protein
MRLSRSLPALLCALVLPFSSLSHGQNNSCLERTFIANVFDRGSVPPGLTKDNFQINYRGQSLVPRNAAYSEGPRRVIVLLDVSGSMNQPGYSAKWKLARLAADDLIAVLPPRSKAGLITFAGTNKTQAWLSADHTSIMDWLHNDEAGSLDHLKGKTALYDAIQSALEQLQPTEPGDAIFVITDGGENASNTRRTQIRGSLRGAGVRLFTLLVPPGTTYDPAELAGSKELAALSNESGGFVETLGDEPVVRIIGEKLTQQLRVQMARLALQISAFYTVTVELPDNPEKPRKWDVSLVDSGKRRKDAWVGYPHELGPCEERTAQK